jgi:hypothetical protein
MTMWQAVGADLLRVAHQVAQWRSPWWVWNVLMVVAGVSALLAALILEPGPGEWVYFHGHQVGQTCAAITVTGFPCPQCGMTRSFVYGARFQILEAMAYNPAGYTLFVWMQVGAVIGAVRLIARDPAAVRVPWQLPVYWTGFWFVFLYLIPYIARLFGVNPLP